MPSYDLDSLVWMASDIVEGAVAQADTNTDEVDITAVSAGNLKKGDRITIAATDFFSANGKPLQVGDIFFWFLVDSQESMGFKPPKGSKMPVSSGLKIILDGKVRGFMQYMNPGGAYEMIPKNQIPDADLPTEEQFVRLIHESIQKVAAIRDHFKGEPDLNEVPYLLSLLKDRPTLPPYGDVDDAIALEACYRIEKISSPQAICEALTFGCAHGFYEQDALFRGLETPQGRDFILTNLADPKADHDVRVVVAKEAILRLGPSYWKVAVASNSKAATQPVRDNHGYLARIASTAASVADDKDLCSAILSSLDDFAQGPGHGDASVGRYPPEVKSDLDDCIPILQHFYRHGADDHQQFQIEEICLDEDDRYFDDLHSPGGPLVGEVYDGYYPGMGPPVPGKLMLGHNFRKANYAASRDCVGILVFQPAAGGRTYQIIEFPELSSGSGAEYIDWPPGLPKGIYHIFCRFEAGGKVIGVSHGFDKKFE